MTEDQKAAITSLATALAPIENWPNQVTIMRRNVSVLSRDLAEAFSAGGWDVSEHNGTGFDLFAPSDVGLVFYDYGDLAPDQECVKAALDAAGIAYDALPVSHNTMARSIIFVA